MAIQCLEKLNFLDSKHLSRVNEQLESGRVLLPKAFLKSCVIGHTGYLSLVFVVESHDILRPTRIVNTGSVKNLESIVDVRMELPRQVLMRSLSFANEAVHFLMQFGRGLHKLQLTSIVEIDIFSIISTCPLLRTVNLYRCYFKNPSLPRPRVIPQHLEKCRIVSEDNLGYEQLLSLLLSPNLRVICLDGCDSLSDDVLETAFRHHRFRKLERLSIENCYVISKNVFTSCFMSESNSLKFIEIVWCPTIGTLENKNEWLSIAASRNWDVEIVVVPL